MIFQLIAICAFMFLGLAPTTTAFAIEPVSPASVPAQKECKDLRYFSRTSYGDGYLQADFGTEDSYELKRPVLYSGVGLCVEEKGKYLDWINVSVADQRQFSGWVLVADLMSEASDKAYREKFRVGRLESGIHGQELVFRDGETAIFLGEGISGAPVSEVRLKVRSVPDLVKGNEDEEGAFKTGKSVSAVGVPEYGILVASTKLDKNPKSATWNGCVPPDLPNNFGDSEKFMEKVKVGKGPALPGPTTCRVQFAGKSVEIVHRMTGFDQRRDSIQYSMRTVLRIDGKETQISENRWVKLKWAGDINGDKKLDIIFSYGSDYNQGESVELWMSDPTSSKLTVASSYVTGGC